MTGAGASATTRGLLRQGALEIALKFLRTEVIPTEAR